MRRVISAFALTLLFAPQTTATDSPPQVKQAATRIVRRFMERTKTPITKTPTIIVQFDPSISSYYVKDNTLHTTAWGQCPPELKKLVGVWAGYTNGQMTDKVLFRELFSWFLIPHEMGHFLQGQKGKLTKKADFLDQEYWANRVAVAFWAEEKGQTPRLARFARCMDAIFKNLKSPVPAGQDARAYFQAHYDELSLNPNAYGWYQLDLMRKAYAHRTETNFKALIAQE